MAAATGNDRPPTVDSRKDGTCSWYDVDERSRRRPGRSATRTNWFKDGGASPCNTRNAMTARNLEIHSFWQAQPVRSCKRVCKS